MGCTPSKTGHPRPIQHISGPIGGLEMIPPQQRDADGRPIFFEDHQLSREQITTALHHMAEYIHQQAREVVLISLGGAVSTILLETREATYDVDFFLPNDEAEIAKLITSASVYAQERAVVPLGNNWLNNSASLFMSRPLREELASEALRQNEKIFEAPGLTIFAAPW